MVPACAGEGPFVCACARARHLACGAVRRWREVLSVIVERKGWRPWQDAVALEAVVRDVVDHSLVHARTALT